jgi:glycolate oxidase
MFSKEVLNDLIKAIGKENVLSEKEDLVTYSYDATAAVPNVLPDVVVTPTSTEHVVENCQNRQPLSGSYLS